MNVAVKGSTAVLTGQVTSWAPRDAVERTAARAPGISAVQNLIDVRPGAF